MKRQILEKAEFETTEVIFVGRVEYDETRDLLLVKNGFKKDYIKPQEIEDIIITCGQKTVSKKNLGSALACAAIFGVGGLLLADTEEIEYISNLNITIITSSNRVAIPLVIGKVKRGTWLKTAEKIVGKIEALAANN